MGNWISPGRIIATNRSSQLSGVKGTPGVRGPQKKVSLGVINILVPLTDPLVTLHEDSQRRRSSAEHPLNPRGPTALPRGAYSESGQATARARGAYTYIMAHRSRFDHSFLHISCCAWGTQTTNLLLLSYRFLTLLLLLFHSFANRSKHTDHTNLTDKSHIFRTSRRGLWPNHSFFTDHSFFTKTCP